MKKFLLLNLFIVIVSGAAQAVVDIPHNLSKSDRDATLRIIGYGTSNKILSDPYPLGGYSGLEFGISGSDFPTEGLKDLGSKLDQSQSDTAYTSFSIGKGLYDNVDLFLNVTPYFQSVQISQFGAQLRWSFYQAETLPMGLSLILNANSTNVENLITIRNIGADLVGGLNVNRVALFGGLGSITSSGDFLGGTRGVTASGYQENESVTGFHFLVGVNVRLSDFFISAELDHYQDTVFSGKIGLRL